MLFDSIANSICSYKLFNKKISYFLKAGLWAANKKQIFKSKLIYKTHFDSENLFKNNLIMDDARIVYVISKPTDTILSTYYQSKKEGIVWFRRHLSNLNIEENFEIDDLLDKDVMQIEKKIFDFSNFENAIIIKYENLWSSEQRLTQFLKYNITLEKYLPRSSLLQKNYPYDLIKRRFKYLDDIYFSYNP